MSRRSSAIGSTPQTSTSSPATSTANISPNSLPPGIRRGVEQQRHHRSPERPTPVPRTNGEAVSSVPQRGFGVPNMLNPSEAQSSSASDRSEGNIVFSSTQAPAAGNTQTFQSPFLFHGQSLARQQQQQQSNSSPSGPPPPASFLTDRGSPHVPRPLPATSATRRILTPRSPRSSSAAHVLHFQPSNAPQSPYHPLGPLEHTRAFSSDSGRATRPLQAPAGVAPRPLSLQSSSSNIGGGRPPSTLPPLATPERPLSQPTFSQSNPTTPQESDRRQSGPTRQPQSQAGFPPITHHPPARAPDPRGYPFPPYSGPSRWPGEQASVMPHGGGTTGGLPPPPQEGHPSFQISPAQGESIVVPIDIYQGSRQADERRQRNAGASARFRQRKKEKEAQLGHTIERLQTRNRELEIRTQELEMERDRHRAERDRLRELVSRTPGISELAYQGPPSPLSPRSGAGSFAERSTLGATPQPPNTMPPMQSYGAADPVTGERAPRRRRLDMQIEFPASPFGSMSSTLPPIPPTAYSTSLSQPGTPAGHTARLPPLRMDQPTGTPTTAPSNASTPVQSLPQFKREPGYESGWATGSRGSHDPRGPHDAGPL
ncbi:hypothetical protein F5Y15DRAFT_246099 [Xylariaceae sp. FL0016]|nr:hypothetical protein F5Y15DRAFT_246099 [Xylariaceae sp. FL0016]